MELIESERARIARLKDDLGWSTLPDEPLLFWSALEEQNAARLPYVARILEELKSRGSCIHDLFCARQYAESGSIPYVLDCLDFMLERYPAGELANLPSAAWAEFFESVIIRNGSGSLEAVRLSAFGPVATVTHRFMAPDHQLYIFDNLIEVVGEVAFLSRVISALSLLKVRAKTDYDELTSLLGQIIQSSYDGVAVDQKPPSYRMSLESALTSVTWCAACIAGAAHHSRLYRSFERRYPGTVVPPAIYSGSDVEMEAGLYQVRVAETIGAPEEELTCIREMDGGVVSN